MQPWLSISPTGTRRSLGSKHLQAAALAGLFALLTALQTGTPGQAPAPAGAPAVSRAEQDAGFRHLAAGRALHLQDKLQEALLEYGDPSVGKCPLWEYGAFWRAGILTRAKRDAEAKPLYEALFNASPNPSFRMDSAAWLADWAETHGDKAGAIPYVLALLETSPNDLGARARLTGLLEDAGHAEEARVQAQWLWTKTPSQPPSAAFFKVRPQWRATFSTLPAPLVLERLQSLAAEGDFKSLGNELPKFAPASPEQSGWAAYLKGRLEEGQGAAATSLATLRTVSFPPEAKFSALSRMGAVLPKAGQPEKVNEAVEASVMAMPAIWEGRQKALVALLKWRIRTNIDRRAAVLAEALIAQGTAQVDACEYLYGTGWDRWLASDPRGAEALWRILAKRLPTDSDYRHAAAYALFRTGRMTPKEVREFKELTLREDRYGYFGYRLRGAKPPAPRNPAASLAQPPDPPGSHLFKGGLLLSLNLAPDAVHEYQMALDEERDLAAQPALLWALALVKSAAGDNAGAIRAARILYPRVFNENGDSLSGPAWRLLYPTPYRDAVLGSSGSSQIPYLLACSVIRQESLWDPDAVSRSGARGLMQLMPATASSLARRYHLTFFAPGSYGDPAWNTRAGCAYLKELLDRYHGRLELALAAYNAGPGRVDAWLARPHCPKAQDLFIESIPFRETRSYVRRILLNCWEYSRLYPECPAPLAPGSTGLAPSAQ